MLISIYVIKTNQIGFKNSLIMKMDLFEYQTKAMNTCMDSSRNMSYMALGLMSEVGEFTGKIAKAIRKGNVYIGKEIQGNIDCKNDSDIHFDYNAFIRNEQDIIEFEKGLRAELGDILWFVAGIAEVMGWDLSEVAQENIAKLSSRKERGVIDGNGDNR